jgi:cephalosporin hydroxylase
MIDKTAVANLFKNIRERFTFDNPILHRDCTEFEVNNWTISRFVLHRLVPIVGVRPFPLNEQMLMVAALCRLQPTHIIEWGTNIGKSARIFYETCRTFGISAEIHSIDLPDDVMHGEHPRKKRGLMVRGKEGVNLHLGDGLETSLYILSQSRNTMIRPLFFVDGDHSYESVKRELEGIISNAPMADILLHDTFYQSAGSGYNIGPARAIDDVLKNMPNDFNLLVQNTGLPGMTLLWRSEHTPGNYDHR